MSCNVYCRPEAGVHVSVWWAAAPAKDCGGWIGQRPYAENGDAQEMFHVPLGTRVEILAIEDAVEADPKPCPDPACTHKLLVTLRVA